MSDLSDSLLKSMELLAQNTVQQSPGTTMIEATIYGEVVNEVEGEYKAQYLDSYLTVYSNDKNIKYNNGDKVYILIPNGDFGKRKIIISSSTSNNISYDKTDIDTFLPVSENLFNSYPEIKLKTYDNSINILENNQYISVGKEIIYDEDGATIELNENPSSIYSLNILDSSIVEHSFNNVFAYYLKDYKTFKLSAKIKTSIHPTQQIKGNYGIILTLPIKYIGSNKETVYTIKKYVLDINTISGNPYRLEEWTIQNMFISLNEGEEFADNAEEKPLLQVFIKDFERKTELDTYDIFIKDINFEVYKTLNENKEGYYLHLEASDGNCFFGAKRDDVNGIVDVMPTKTLTPHLKLDGKEVKLDSKSDKIKEQYLCYWFIEDASIKTNSELYVSYGGVGWRCLNNKINISYNSDNTESFDYFTGAYQYIVKRENVLSSSRFKCVIVIMKIVNNVKQYHTIVDSIVKLEELTEPLKLSLKSMTGSFVYPEKGSMIHLQGGIESGYVLPYENADTTIYYEWNRYDSEGNYIDNNFYEEINGTLDSKTQEIQFSSDLISNKFNTITCSIYDQYIEENGKIVIDRLLGSISSAITLDDTSASVTLKNGNVLYKYDGDGDSPISSKFDGQLGSKMIIQPIELSIYNNETGLELTDDEYRQCTIKWYAPGQSKTLIIPMMGKDDITKENEITGKEELKNQNSFDINEERDEHIFTLTGLSKDNYKFIYTIANSYDYTKINNTVKVEIIFNQQTTVISTDFIFMKEGDIGTNNSNYTAIITHNGDGYGEYFPLQINKEYKDGELVEYDTVNVERKLQLVYIQGIYENLKKVEEGTNNPTDEDVEVPRLDKEGNIVKDENGNVIMDKVVVIKPFENCGHWYYYDIEKEEMIQLGHIEPSISAGTDYDPNNSSVILSSQLPSLKLRVYHNGKEIELDKNKIKIEWSVLDPEGNNAFVLLKSLSESNNEENNVNTFNTSTTGLGCQIAPLKFYNSTVENEKIRGISLWENDSSVNIIKATITIYNNEVPTDEEAENDNSSTLTQDFTELYAYYPIELIVADTEDIISTKEENSENRIYNIPNISGGFSFVTYSADGKSPRYNNTIPFNCVNNINPEVVFEYNNYTWTGSENIDIKGYEYEQETESGEKEFITKLDTEKIWAVPKASYNANNIKNFIRADLDNLGIYENKIEKLNKEKININNDITFLSDIQDSLLLKVTENKKTTLYGVIIDTLKKANLPIGNSKPYLTYRMELYNQINELEKKYNNMKKKYFSNQELVNFEKLKNSLLIEKYEEVSIFDTNNNKDNPPSLDTLYITLEPLLKIIKGENENGYDYLNIVISKMDECIEKETKESQKKKIRKARNEYENYIKNTIEKKIIKFNNTVINNNQKSYNIKESYFAFCDLKDQYLALANNVKTILMNTIKSHYPNKIKDNITIDDFNEKEIENIFANDDKLDIILKYYKIYNIIINYYQGFDNLNNKSYGNISSNIINKMYADIKKEYYDAEKKILRKKITDPIKTLKKSLNKISDDITKQIQEMESLYIQAQKQDNAVVLTYIRPIIMTTNRYELTSISGWDGSRLYVDKQNEAFLYAPQVGAGRKNRDGSFTGMVMGRRNVRSSNDEAVGLFGYSSGAQSMFLDANTGAAYFGINNEIILDPRPGYASTIAGWGLGADKIESKGILSEQGKSYKVGLYTPTKIINNNGDLVFEHAFTSSNNIHPIAFGAEYDGNYAYITYDGHFYSNKGEIKGSKIVDSTLSGTTKIDAEIDSLFTIKKLEEKVGTQTETGFEFSSTQVRHYILTQIKEPNKNSVITFTDGEWKLEKNGKATFNNIDCKDRFSIGYEPSESDPNQELINKWKRENINGSIIETFHINNAKICEWDIDHGIMSRNYIFIEDENNKDHKDDLIEKIIKLNYNGEERFYLKGDGKLYSKTIEVGNGASGTFVSNDGKVITVSNGIITEIK